MTPRKLSAKRSSSQNLTLLLFVAADVLGLLTGALTAYAVRFEAGLIPVKLTYDPRTYLHFIAFIIPVWIFWLHRTGCYEFLGRAFNREIMGRVGRASFKATLTFVVWHFFTRNTEFSRMVYLMGFVGSVFGIGLARFAVDRSLAKLRRRGFASPARVALVGLHTLGKDIAARVNRHSFLGLQIEGFIYPGDKYDVPVGSKFGNMPILGSLNDLPELIEKHRLNELIVNAPELSADDLLELVFECEKHFVIVRVAPNLLQHRMVQLDVEQIDGIPLFGLKQTPMTGWNLFLKRTFDIVTTTLLLAVLAIPMGVIALLVRLTSPGPALYKQTRVSLDRHEFTLYKFRSMVINDGTAPTRPNDNRITKFGRFLRRTSLDELPQLWNVLRGNMSLVGPRPERPHLVEQHRERIPRYMGRLRVPAGMTGLAQINGMRQSTSLEERIRYDIEYIENWSFWLDIKILLLTLLSLNRNAY